jgi:drug/metabolite transporter (DMT)-like permease
MTGFLFGVNILVWGFSWIAITVQIRETTAEVALLYRLGLAALVLFLVLAATGRLRPVTMRQQPYLALMGLCLFCLNYMLVYHGTSFIPSGVVALVFSTATGFNAFNSMMFYGDRQSLRFIFGAGLGMAGLGCLFWRDLTQLDLGSTSLIGGALVLAGTYVFSLGNMVSRRNNAAGIDLPTATAWSMGWGTLFLACLTLGRGLPLPLDLSWNWRLPAAGLVARKQGFETSPGASPTAIGTAPVRADSSGRRWRLLALLSNGPCAQAENPHPGADPCRASSSNGVSTRP